MDEIANEIKYSRQKADWIKNNLDIFYKDIRRRLPILRNLKAKYDFHGGVLEIGAGSSWLSALVSRIPAVKKVYALDVSRDLLETADKYVIDRLNGARNKIELVNSDFNCLPFEDNKFDVILCDASLHHAGNLSVLLKEIYRVLKKKGFLIAIREPVKPLIYWRKFGKSETAKGATEHIYKKKEWKKYFKDAGLQMEIVTDFSNGDAKTFLFKFPPLNLLNGIVFSRYHFFAVKK